MFRPFIHRRPCLLAPLSLAQELIEALGPALDSELDHLVPILVKKAGVVSVAGRDNFLAVEADRALTLLVATGSEVKMAVALLNCLGMSKATDMKAKVAMHLDACVQRCGGSTIRCSSKGPAALWAVVVLTAGQVDRCRA